MAVSTNYLVALVPLAILILPALLAAGVFSSSPSPSATYANGSSTDLGTAGFQGSAHRSSRSPCYLLENQCIILAMGWSLVQPALFATSNQPPCLLLCNLGDLGTFVVLKLQPRLCSLLMS